MKIEKLSDLKKVIALCREYGVNIIKIDGIDIVLEGSPAAIKINKARAEVLPTYTPGGITESTPIATPDALTEEQLLFYSAGEQQ